MDKKKKILFRGSIIVNVLLIIIIIIGYLKMNLVHEELFYSEVQWKLVELDGLITYQIENDWSEPNLATTQMGDILNGIEVAKNSGQYSGWIANKERETMERLYAALSRYPHDYIYEFSNVTQEDQQHFEDLQEMLQSVGFGMNMTISNEWKTFLAKSEKLLELLRSQNMHD